MSVESFTPNPFVANPTAPRPGGPDLRGENADVVTSSAEYAWRFAGPVGRWFLEVQEQTTLTLLSHLAPGASVLEIGGGHAQLTPSLIRAGYAVTVVGSEPACAARLAAWLDRGACRFQVADLGRLPLAERAFDAVLCFRMLPHSIDWARLVGELCRVARRTVVADYPTRRSLNVIADRLLPLKRWIEEDTRPFLVFDPDAVHAAFARHGFEVRGERPQFVLPMALHRWLGSARVGRAAEACCRMLGLTRWFGSPVILRADRRD